MDREDIESRRAENQFWNGAENYQLRADFQMYRPDGEADLYFNTIIGLVYRLYDYERLRPLFNTFQSQTSGAGTISSLNFPALIAASAFC